MQLKKKICITCEKECFYWKGKQCKSCSLSSNSKPIRSKKKSIAKISPKGLIKKQEKKKYTEKQFELFMEIWAERPHISFESGLPIYGEPTSIMFHHCLEKGIEKYKKYALEKWNIVLLLGSEHTQVHADISKTPKVQEYTKKLKELYG